MSLQSLLHLSGYATAFLMAVVVIMVDCNSALRKALTVVQISVLRSRAVWTLAGGCGIVAAVCFRFSEAKFLTDIVELKWAYPPGRGALVGLAVLTILRSKFFNFKDTEVGGEFIYNKGREWANNALYQKWLDTKEAYTTTAILTAACQNTTFEKDLIDAVTDAIKLQPPAFQKSIADQFNNIKKDKPATAVDCSDKGWLSYYRTLIKCALDATGTQIWPRLHLPAPGAH